MRPLATDTHDFPSRLCGDGVEPSVVTEMKTELLRSLLALSVAMATVAVSAEDRARPSIADGEFVAPPVTGHVHASTILPLKGDGEYLAAWFEGTKESAKDVAIRGSRRIGGKWEPVRTFAKVNPESPHWNPVLRRADDGRIELFFKVGRNCADWRTYVEVSRDEGVTWSHVKLIEDDPAGWFCYIAIQPLDDGTVLLGYCSRGLDLSRLVKVPMEWFYK